MFIQIEVTSDFKYSEYDVFNDASMNSYLLNICAELLLKQKESLNEIVNEKMFSPMKSRISMLEIENSALRSTEVFAGNISRNVSNIIEEKLSPLTKLFNYESMAQKGEIGENQIIRILQENYNRAVIQNTSMTDAFGDIYFGHGDIKCLVEVKYKKIITAEDIKKFYRDIEVGALNGRINCGIFISLVTENIPEKGHCAVEISSECPVIFLGANGTPHIIKYAMNILEYLLRLDNDKAPEIEQQTELIEKYAMLLSEISKNVNSEKAKIIEIVKSAKSIIKLADELAEKVDANINSILKSGELKNTPRNAGGDCGQFTAEEIEKIHNYMREHKKVPSGKVAAELLKCSLYKWKKHGRSITEGIK